MNTLPGRLDWSSHLLRILSVTAVLAAATLLGLRASAVWLGLLAAGIGAVVLLRRPALGLPALVLAALVVPLEIGTGTEVQLNAATLLIPALVVVWIVTQAVRQQPGFAPARANRPLLFFLGASLLSLLIGSATWDPMVPRSGNFTLVQLAQWAIFAFSALAFWLTANLAREEKTLRLLTFVFLGVGGSLAVLQVIPGSGGLASPIATEAFIRAPFWVLLMALAGGLILFHRRLPLAARLLLIILIVAALVYAFVQQQDAASNWVGIGAALAVLVWLRFPRLRWLMLLLVVALTVIGVLFPAVYNFAGGDAEWTGSGASRLVLIERVVEVTLRNPITGLGPAGYRPYANATPLKYQRAYWIEPRISSHNNYVDLFAHGGLLGLALFTWFIVEIGRLGARLRRRYCDGFAAGYVNGILAAGAASLVLMLLADWILPFVYNIGFPGFQASMLVWLFMGGLVALDHLPDTAARSPGLAAP